MSHTQITSLLLGFILIFQRASSSQFHGIALDGILHDQNTI